MRGRPSLHSKILGSLIGSAAGDAMGAATKARTTEQILERFGHRVTDFETPPMDTFAAGSAAGQVTDDFSSAYFVIWSIVRNEGRVDEELVKAALVEWSEHEMFFDRFAGPTTRMAIELFKTGREPSFRGINLSSRQATNGAAMRIAPVGLLFPGSLDLAVGNALRVARLTHDNVLALSGACAVAAAVNRALSPDADLYSVLEAGLYGAVEGERLGMECSRDVAGPRVVSKLELALDIGLSPLPPELRAIEVRDRIGTGLHIAEAVPAAFGILASRRGDAMETLIDCVNIGYDTDTLATIAGGIAGALSGSEAFPEHFLPTLESVNGFEIERLADCIHELGLRAPGLSVGKGGDSK